MTYCLPTGDLPFTTTIYIVISAVVYTPLVSTVIVVRATPIVFDEPPPSCAYRWFWYPAPLIHDTRHFEERCLTALYLVVISSFPSTAFVPPVVATDSRRAPSWWVREHCCTLGHLDTLLLYRHTHHPVAVITDTSILVAAARCLSSYPPRCLSSYPVCLSSYPCCRSS